MRRSWGDYVGRIPSAGRLGHHSAVVALPVALAIVLMSNAGCGTPVGLAPGSPEARLFAPIPEPPGFDRKRALTPLPDVPDAPAPPATTRAPEVELPRQALRHLEEARRLFGEQRFSETSSELTSALRYNDGILEAHRMLALASLLSGNTGQAKTHAERALALFPADASCHYVLGRLAHQTQDRGEAVRRYRTVLLCAPTAEDAGYRALTNYHLGLLLEADGYHAASVEQLKAFCVATVRLTKERMPENPELASILRTQLGAVISALVRSEGVLGRYAEAAETLGAAVQLAPNDWMLRGEHVRMLGRAGLWHPAEEASAAFVVDSGARPEACDLMLAVYRAAGRPEGAVTRVRGMLAQHGDNPDFKLLHVDALLGAERLDEAAKVLAEVAATSPDRPEVRMKLISLSRARGDWRAWLDTLARELADRPANLSAVEQELARMDSGVAESFLAQRAEEAGSPAVEARRLPVLDGRPRAAMDYLLAQTAQRLGRTEQARGLLEASVARWADFAPAGVALARARMDEARWGDALELLGVAHKQMDRPDAEIESLMAQCNDGLDRFKQSVEHYQKAIQLNSSNAAVMMRLARLYERMGDIKSANRQYEAVVAADHANQLAREGIIRTSWSIGDQGQMMRLVEQIGHLQRQDPDGPVTQRCLALIQMLQPPRPDLKAYAARMRELVATFPADPRNREELIGTLVTLRDYEAARKEIDELLKRDPRSVRGNEMLALVLMRQLDFENAAAQLERMIARHPNRVSWLTELVQLKMYDRQYEAALGIWNHLVGLAEADEDGNLGRALALYRARLMQAYRTAGRFDEARRVAEQWLAAVPADTSKPENESQKDQMRWFLLAADSVARENDRYLARVRGWLKDDPNSRLLQGWLLGVGSGYPPGAPGLPPGSPGLIGARRFDEAALLVLAWLADNPKDADLFDWLIDVLKAAGRFDESIELATSQLAIASGVEQRVDRLVTLRNVYQRARRHADTIDVAKRIVAEMRKLLVEVEPQRRGIVDAFLFDQQRMLGMLLIQARRFDEAIAHIRQMIESADEARRGAEEIAQQQNAEAARRYQAMRQIQQSRQRQTMLLRALALAYQRQDNVVQAEVAGRDAYKLMPDDVGLNNDLGYTLADAGKELAEAERMIRYAVGESPDEAAYLDSLGWVLYKRGRFEEACKWLLRASAVEDGQDALIYDHLGDAQWRLGRRDDAIRSWKRSIELHEQSLLTAESEVDDKFAERTRKKLAAVDDGKVPEVAPLGAASQPASAGG